MKKCIVLFCLSIFALGLNAQNRSIEFEQSKDWKKIVRKAKSQKKLIFVDCYTDWCGPCKVLANNVFTKDDVADFFNSTFINAKFEMEKDKDGIMLKDKFSIKAFPTLVFVDPKTEEIVHKVVGAGTADWLIAGGKQANDPQNNLKGMMKRYEDGERNPEFLSNYLKALSSAYMQDIQGAVANDYLNNLSDELLATRANWELIKDNVDDPLSRPLRYVMANRGKFYAIADETAVNQKLSGAVKGAAMSMIFGFMRSGEFDQNRYTELVKYISSIDFEGAPVALVWLYASNAVKDGNYREMLDLMLNAYKFNLFRRGENNIFFQTFIERLDGADDENLVREGVAWIDQLANNSDDPFGKASLMGSKARLLTAIGDVKGAEKAKADEVRYAKEGEEKSGGRIQRAIRMN